MMGDLISREALLVALDYGRTHNVGVRQIVSEAPTVDAVQVVRCRDCMHSHETRIPGQEFWFCGKSGYVLAHGYCNYGKRMDADAPEQGGEDLHG